MRLAISIALGLVACGSHSSVPKPAPDDAAIRSATKKLQSRVDQLQTELDKSRKQYSTAEKEKESLSGKLQNTNSKLEKAEGDLHSTRWAGAGRRIERRIVHRTGPIKTQRAVYTGELRMV